MTQDLLQRLTGATTDAEREAIVLEMSLSALSHEMQDVVKIAAVPHWFDASFLEALLGDESDTFYEQLLTLSFVDQIPGKGYAIHERTRKQLLHTLWQNERDRFFELSDWAAAYCQTQATEVDEAGWQAEAIYHQLVSDPDVGVAGLRGLATKWANYEHHTYDEIEQTIRLANEQIEAGRLTGSGADWTRLWQAKLALIYNRPELAADSLAQIEVETATDPYLAAEVWQTQGDMLARMGDTAEMERAWRTAYDLYQSLDNQNGQLDAYLVAEKMRRHGLPTPEDTVADTTPLLTPPTGNALKLIDNIHAAWIEGVLHTSLDKTIDLRMARDGSQPSNLVFHRPQSVDSPVAAGERLSSLFAAANGSLLILGAPGSGKTITLLQLLDDLLQQARADRTASIPLLLNLSSFAAYARENEGDLTSWLADQAYHQYRLKRQTTRERLAAGDDFVLLLDGLDEVTQADGLREQCVEAINQFMQQTPCGLVVCSRIGDYQALNNQLDLAHALVLQPLSNRQIETFINQVDGLQQEAMQEQIQADWQLREALRSPLLLNLYPQAFPIMQATVNETIPPNDTVEARRQALFAAYVKTVFEQSLPVIEPPTGVQDAKPEKGADEKGESIRWLAFLANRMQQIGTSLFFVEELQPTWMPQRLLGRYRALYGLIGGLIGGLIVGLSDGLIFELFNCTIQPIYLSFILTSVVILFVNFVHSRYKIY
ncbi:MAG: NACHT domain-containing protein [Chloroflexi bacterium]|nr:NACHT domain-containing protein [Chloroflexota bacterium]